ncbi:MAG: hypothetical protein HY782_02315 [Chloroflexi bacterium]|nr:hypothetical protein [Chloroflexota bacterium]
MIHKTSFQFVCALVIVIAVVGCGTSPTPAPTKAAATEAPKVITVVITQTPLPRTATPAQPSITPIPTLVLTATVPVATPIVKATTASTPRPAASRTPTRPAATAMPTAIPLKYAAPRLIGPVFDVDSGRRDERHYPADVLKFEWQSVGTLGEGECYLVHVEMIPGQGDSFLQCDPRLATQVGAGAMASFTLNKPTQVGPNYSALIPTQVGDTTVHWYVQVVKDLGKGPGASAPDGVRHTVAPLSPKSSTFQFPLKGQ